MMKLLSKPLLLKSYFFLGALESAIVFSLLVSTPSDVKNSIFLGFSLPKLFMLAGTLVLFLVFGLFFVRLHISDGASQKAVLLIENIADNRLGYLSTISFSLLFLVFGIIILLVPPERLPGYAAFIERLAPIIYLGSVIGLQTLLGLFSWRGRTWNWQALAGWKKAFIITGIGIGILLIFSAWVAWSGIGLVPEKHGWHFPGTPILFSQLLLAWLVSLPFVLWDNSIGKWAEKLEDGRFSFIRLDAIICLILWMAAFLIWWGEPVQKDSYFTPTPTPPNFEYYPYSDAANYDLNAQNMLIGAVQSNRNMIRPMYVFFLALLHTLGGQQYENVIFFQVLFVAAIPALAYLVATMIGGRPVGLLVAILTIFREKNAISLTNVIEVSHSKLYMSDVPTLALMLLFVYLLMKWLQDASVSKYAGVFAGASFGLVMLMRSHQSLLIIPVLIIGIVFSGGFQLKRVLQRSLLFILGFALVTAPWIWRNYQVAGKPVIENSEFYMGWYAGAYAEPTETGQVLPGESPEEYSRRIKQQVFRYILNHPLELTRGYTSYFVHNEIVSVASLPMSLKLYDMRSYISVTRYWREPITGFSFDTGLVFFATLGMIIFGVGIAVQRLGFLGLLPLLIHFFYNFSVSLARISGWRFVQPADWILYLYFAVGLVILTSMVISLMTGKSAAAGMWMGEAIRSVSPVTNKHRAALAFFIIFGISLPVTEMLIPQRYPEMDDGQLVAQHVGDGLLLANGDSLTASDINSFLETEPAATVLYGRALYPLYYPQGSYWGKSDPFRDFNRLQFNYIGSGNALVFIQMDVPPEYFPNASDVFIIGCKEKNGVRALAIKVNSQSPVVTVSPWQGLDCATE